ncbi:MAG: hypothetical protein R3B96_23180 [Pirellulaceae bacterium]
MGLAGKYATWCGTVLDKTVPIVVIAEEGAEEKRSCDSAESATTTSSDTWSVGSSR